MISIVCIAINLLVVFLFLRLYCRLTVGRCHSQQYMSGKTVLITGATAGIGKATAFNLAQRNARVILACRNLEKAEKVKLEIIGATGNANVAIKHLDLESFDSVRKCAEDVLKTEKRLDVLINNAGICEVGELTKDGCEKVMQVNFFGHFLLTLLLLDLLKKSKPSRIVIVSSLMFLCAVLDMEDINGFKDNWLLRNTGSRYSRSKWAGILLTVELARRLDGEGVTVNCLHPGLVETDIHDTCSWHILMKIFIFLVTLLGKSAEEGAQTSIYLAVDPDLQNVTGKFFSDCGESMLLWLRTPSKMLARKFFQLSEETVGVTLESR